MLFPDVSAKAREIEHVHPILIIRGSPKNPKDGFIICEKVLMSKADLADIPIILFATYYVFNMEYSIGCSSFLW